MAVTYNTNVKNSRLNAVRDAIDAGAGPGTLEICTAGYATVLAILTLSDPSAPNASGGVLTFNAITQDSAADNTGTAAVARIKDSSGTVVIDGLTVGTSGANINLNTVSIVANDIVQITSASITHG